MLNLLRFKGILPIFLGSVCGMLFGTIFQYQDYLLSKDYSSLERLKHLHADSEAWDDKNLNVLLHNDENQTYIEEDETAKKLRTQIRIHCTVLIGAKHHGSFVPVIQNTWGKRCTKLLFISAEKNPNAPRDVMKLPDISDDVGKRWTKMRASLNFLYDTYIENYDWFLITDHDEFVVMENLRHMLQKENPEIATAFGSRLKSGDDIVLADSSFVLSKEALQSVVLESFPYPDKCNAEESGSPNSELSFCLKNVNCVMADSRDEEGRERFLPLHPQNLLMPNVLPENHWYRQQLYHPFKDGLECCSDKAIGFHASDVAGIYLMEYMIYHLHPFGIDTLYDESLKKYIRDDPPVPKA